MARKLGTQPRKLGGEQPNVTVASPRARRINRRQYLGAGIGLVAGGLTLQSVTGNVVATDGDVKEFVTDFSEYASW